MANSASGDIFKSKFVMQYYSNLVEDITRSISHADSGNFSQVENNRMHFGSQETDM